MNWIRRSRRRLANERAQVVNTNEHEREPMRQGQQNRRGRGRNNNNNNNNRKSQNPLMRSFESSGPDVKIRGTPSHIAEKYITLGARCPVVGRSGAC